MKSDDSRGMISLRKKTQMIDQPLGGLINHFAYYVHIFLIKCTTITTYRLQRYLVQQHYLVRPRDRLLLQQDMNFRSLL